LWAQQDHISSILFAIQRCRKQIYLLKKPKENRCFKNAGRAAGLFMRVRKGHLRWTREHGMHYGVISPYILRKIIDNGSGLRQSCARQTLAHVQMLMAAQLKGGDC